MTVLSENLKIIRKKLNYTQIALSEVLEIGFRTYVRYEAGERDAPISVIAKLARLGNVSIDRLLTKKILSEDLKTPDKEKLPTSKTPLEIISGGLEEGRLMFKGLLVDHLISTNEEERKLLTLFRKMNATNREKFLMDADWIYTNTGKSARYRKPNKISRKEEKAKNAVEIKETVKKRKK